MECDSYGFEHGSFFVREIVGQPMDDAGGYIDKLGEGAGAPVVAAGDAENFAAIAEIDVATSAVRTFSAINGGVEGDAVALSKSGNIFADICDDPSGFMTHDQRWDATSGGTIVAVHVTAANSAGGDAHQNLSA